MPGSPVGLFFGYSMTQGSEHYLWLLSSGAGLVMVSKLALVLPVDAVVPVGEQT